MSYNANYPVSLDSLANPSGTNNRNDPGFSLAGLVGRLQDIVEALEAKVGIGASTPSAASVLRRTSGASTAWGQVQGGDVANNTLGAGHIAGPGAGSANTVLRTTDGTNTAYGKLVTADVTAGALSEIKQVGCPTAGTPVSYSGSYFDFPQATLPFTFDASAALLWGFAIQAVFSPTVGRLIFQVCRTDNGAVVASATTYPGAPNTVSEFAWVYTGVIAVAAFAAAPGVKLQCKLLDSGTSCTFPAGASVFWGAQIKR